MGKDMFCETLLEASASGVVAIDPSGRIVIFNRAAEGMLGLRKEKVLGKPIGILEPFAELRDVLEKGKARLNSRVSVGFSTFMVGMTPVYRDGKRVGAVAVFQDVTELCKMASELHDTRVMMNILRTIVEHAFEGAVLVDREGFITMISERYARFLGYSSSKEIVGKHVTDVIENTRMHIVARSGIPEYYDVQKIGHHKIVCSRIPIYQDGEVVGAFGKMIFKDVTEMEHILARVKLLEDRLKDYQKELSRLRLERYRFENLIGVSGKFRRALQMARKAANNDLNVLIVGEPGTGKGLFAHAIHANGRGNRFPIVTVNCVEGIDGEAFRSQLVLASGGTIFLKHIDELDMTAQLGLLEALKEGLSREGREYGGLRIIATSVEDPEELMAQGRLRPELFYFISEVLIHLPPLRERKEDIPLLADYFLSEVSFRSGKGGKTFTSQAMEALAGYSWPGNIIELRSAVKYSFSLSEGRYILTDHLPPKVLEKGRRGPGKESLHLMREDAEKRIILETLYQCNRNVTEAARRLGIHRTTLHRKLRRLGLK